jgi:NADPH:quinone reductase-like Zn-dependent oxidoreductase
MRALVFDPDAPRSIRLGDAPDPVPGPHQALVDVAAVSLNFGEVAFIARRAQPGDVPGWDAAGLVARAAEDGSGPAAGTRVVTVGGAGAWAQRRAVDVDQLAVVPDSVDLGAASALPVAGATALQALRKLGPVIGRRILVTGASGGVGRFAVQLAARAGAHVVAAVGSAPRAEGLAELGASEVVVGLENLSAPVSGVLDNVGGPLLAQALEHVEDGGVIQWVGVASQQPTQLSLPHHEGRRWRLEAFTIAMPIGGDIAYLVELLDRKEIDPQIGWRTSWEHAQDAADALLSRRVAGKVVLDIG